MNVVIIIMHLVNGSVVEASVSATKVSGTMCPTVDDVSLLSIELLIVSMVARCKSIIGDVA